MGFPVRFRIVKLLAGSAFIEKSRVTGDCGGNGVGK